MTARDLGSILSGLMLLATTSTLGDDRPPAATAVTTPIIIESQIRDVASAHLDQGDDVSGDAVLIHLIRQPYDILAPAGLCVRTDNHHCGMYARDLQKNDNVRIEGNLDRKTVTALRITLQLRIEHRP